VTERRTPHQHAGGGDPAGGQDLPVDLQVLRNELHAVFSLWFDGLGSDGGRAGYRAALAALLRFLSSQASVIEPALRIPLVKLMRDLGDVESRGVLPVAFRPRHRGAGAATSDEVERNAMVAAALHLHAIAGDPVREVAQQMARDLTKAGHQRQARGRGERTITARTVLNWRDTAQRTTGKPAPHRELFLLLTDPCDGAERDVALTLRRVLALSVLPPSE
jgi:hypothetical protein